jgi:hypothetical protein
LVSRGIDIRQKKRSAVSVCIALLLLFTLNQFSVSSFDFKKVTLSEKSVYAQEPVEDSENNVVPLVGVNMRGYYTNIPQERDFKTQIPPNYYEESFKTLSQSGIDFVRYLFFWESFERDPFSFMNELKTVAQTADKWGIGILYANDQYHTSSWLEPKTATGFPASLFEDNAAYPYGTGGAPGPKDLAAKKWWGDWLNRSVKGGYGADGWTLQAEFLKNIVNAVDKHKSTLGYEILNEPHVRSADQWEKVGKYNSFMTDELRSVTNKTIFYDRQVPADLYGPVNATPENMAKMAPANKENVVFKSTLYGVPFPKSFAEDRLNAYVKAAELAGVPLCMCEFNMKPYKQYPEADVEANQTLVNMFINKFQEVNVWGWAYWLWNFRPHTNPNFNLISVTEDESIQPTQNFEFIKNTIAMLGGEEEAEKISRVTTNGSSDPTEVSSSAIPPQIRTSFTQSDRLDTIFPTVNITRVGIASPVNDSVTVSGQAFDVGTDIREVGVRIDGGRFESANPDKENGWLEWSASVPVENLEEGEHEVVARAIDNANHTKRETVTFSIQ